MEQPSIENIVATLARITALIEKTVKHVEDLQDIVLEQQTMMDQLMLKQPKISLSAIFTLKPAHPPVKIDAPKQKKDSIFWLPITADCNSIGGKN